MNRSGSNRVIVVGGGLFGVTSAWALARAGWPVTLVEQAPDLLSGASGTNQYRLHRGFHYPRSPETAAACLAAEQEFRSLFADAVIDDHTHYYAVASRHTRLTAAQYLRAVTAMGLTWCHNFAPVLRRDAVDTCVRVAEGAIDVPRLRQRCWSLLDDSGVRVRTGTRFEWAMVGERERVVLATYSANNTLLAEAGVTGRPYRYQLAELLCVQLPDRYRGVSCLVMDGAFPSLDPCGRTGHHVIGHVTEMHHAEETGVSCTLTTADAHRRSTAAGTLRRLVATGREFLIDFDQARLLRSRLVVRTTLPDVGRTDERPTLVERHHPRVFSILSGKLTTCVTAARDLVESMS
jgi:glycine/D-amino acid oxidase-like deaminating enzyme